MTCFGVDPAFPSKIYTCMSCYEGLFESSLIPSDFDAYIIISQGFQRLLIRMSSKIYRVSKRFAGPAN